MNTRATRVLVVDDSATSRALIIGVLSSDPELLVVGEARDGLEAIEMTKLLRPDVITMDIRMPKLDGIEATKRIMTEIPTPIVIVSGIIDPCHVHMSLQALRVGALTVLSKPEGPHSGHFETNGQVFARTVKALSTVKVIRRRDPQSLRPPSQPRPAPSNRAKIVAIGGSTGGPAALRVLLEHLPADFGAPILVVQHIAPGFMSGLASWLASSCKLQVKLAAEAERLVRGTVYVSPEQCHLRVGYNQVRTDHSPPIGGFRPAASAVFESMAEHYGESAIAVVLTGMGRDGVEGLRLVRENRGFVIAQDEATSAVFGMPRAAIEAGVVDEVLALRDIAPRLDLLTRQEGPQ